MAPVPETVLPVTVANREFRLASWQRETGSEDLIVLIHGLGCSKKSFAGAWSRPDYREWSLLAIDLPGFGRSPRPADYSYDLKEQARLLSAVLDQRASRRVHVLAHSMGATTALLMPTRTLSRLASLVLVEPRLTGESCGVAAEASRYPEENFDSLFLASFRQRVAKDPRVAFDAAHADPLAFQRSASSLLRWASGGDMVPLFLSAPCPAWFVYGAENRHLAELRELPAGQTLAIDSAAHFPMHDNPEAFYAAMAVLIESAARDAPGGAP